MKGDEQRSPKGLITNRLQDHPAHGLPDTRQQIAACLLSCRQFAASLIEASGRKADEYSEIARNSDELDHASAAAHVLKRCDYIDAYLALFDRQGRPAVLLGAVHQALLLAIRVHQMTIVDNEPAIDARLKSAQGGQKGGHAKAAKCAPRDGEMAREFVRRRAELSRKSDTAIKEEIGKEHGLQRRASIDAIDRGLKSFVQQRAFLDQAYQTDEAGRLVYPEQVYSAPKKSGKTGFGALHGLTTCLVFGGPFAEGYCLANDLEQSQGRVFQAMRRIVEASPYLVTEAKITASRIEFPATGATIQAIASDYAGAAGGNPTVAVFDELWGYVSERSRRLWDEMVPPPTRKIACRLTVTYAGFEGESVLLEELYKRGLKQPALGLDLHAGGGLLMFWTHRPIAPWQTEGWLDQMRAQLRTNAYLRMIENRWVTSESSFVDLDWWDACVDHGHAPVVADKRLPVWVGVDASVKRDSTAIVAVTWDDQTKKVVLVWHRIFQPSAADPLDFELTIAATVRELGARFELREVRFDPYQMQAVAQQLVRDGVPMVEFPQSVPNLTETSTNLFELIKGRGIVVYSDAEIRLAISRSVALETTRGWRIAKEKQSHKIDVVVALAMAAHAAVQHSGEEAYDWTYSWVGDFSKLGADVEWQRAAYARHVFANG